MPDGSLNGCSRDVVASKESVSVCAPAVIAASRAEISKSIVTDWPAPMTNACAGEKAATSQPARIKYRNDTAASQILHPTIPRLCCTFRHPITTAEHKFTKIVYENSDLRMVMVNRIRRLGPLEIIISWAMKMRAVSLIVILLSANSVPADLHAQSVGGLTSFGTGQLTIKSGAKSHRFSVEIAQTQRQHTQGLMFRRKMAAEAGMLFVYRRDEPTAMWMKNTFIPLDMLFIGADGRIIHIRERTVPHSLTPVRSKGDALAVLELNGGTSSRLGIKLGDLVRHKIFRN